MSTKISKGARLHLLRVVELRTPPYQILPEDGVWFLYVPSTYSDVIALANRQMALVIGGPDLDVALYGTYQRPVDST
jgi:hypothetical protein